MVGVPELADIVELQTWANERAYSVSTLEEDLRAGLPVDDREEAEAFAREVFELLGERSRLLGPAYPFTYDGTTLTPNERKNNSSYLFCLGLTLLTGITHNLRSEERRVGGECR